MQNNMRSIDDPKLHITATEDKRNVWNEYGRGPAILRVAG